MYHYYLSFLLQAEDRAQLMELALYSSDRSERKWNGNPEETTKATRPRTDTGVANQGITNVIAPLDNKKPKLVSAGKIVKKILGCGKNGHNRDSCWKYHPEKRPKWIETRDNKEADEFSGFLIYIYMKFHS